jgi:hypothetical protein
LPARWSVARTGVASCAYFVPAGGELDAASVLPGFQECGADGVFELVELVGEDGLSGAEVLGGVVEIGVSGDREKPSDA